MPTTTEHLDELRIVPCESRAFQRGAPKGPRVQQARAPSFASTALSALASARTRARGQPTRPPAPACLDSVRLLQLGKSLLLENRKQRQGSLRVRVQSLLRRGGMLAVRAVTAAHSQTRGRIPRSAGTSLQGSYLYTARKQRLQHRVRVRAAMADQDSTYVVGRGAAAKRRGVVHRLFSRNSRAPDAESSDSDKDKAPRPFGGRVDPDVIALVLVYFIQGALG